MKTLLILLGLSSLPCAAQTGITPMTDMAPADTYLGCQGGLYPSGSNSCPADHLQDGIGFASTVTPVNAAGQASASGLIGVAALGMSNTKICWAEFMNEAALDLSLNPRVRFANGAQPGKDVLDWSDPASPAGSIAWNTFEAELLAAGLTAKQLQVVFVVNLGQRWWNQSETVFPASAIENQVLLVKVAQQVQIRYPSVKLLYGTALTYGGYCQFDDGSPGAPYPLEPWAFESAFSYKWAIEQQINHDPAVEAGVAAPWMAWCSYLWADGTTPRSDGLTWQLDDFLPDHHHESSKGSAKVAALLLNFIKTDPTAKLWALPQAPPPAGGGNPTPPPVAAADGSGRNCGASGSCRMMFVMLLALGMSGTPYSVIRNS